MSQSANAKNAEEYACFDDSAASGAAANSHVQSLDSDLQNVVDRWKQLPQEVRLGIVAIVSRLAISSESGGDGAS